MSTDTRSLWQKDSYTTESFDYIISKRIIEYDMKDAGYNLAIYFELLPQKKIDYLAKLEKHFRRVQLGIYMRDDAKFNTELTESFGKMRQKFIEDNNLDDSDILSIKKDALFIIGKHCDTKSYGNVNFVEKNVYSSWHRFNGVEMYYNRSKNKIDVKGISDDLLYQHKLILGIFQRLFNLLETNSHDDYVKFIKKFVDDYKNCRLAYGYYREFNANGMFALKSNTLDQTKFYIPDITDNTFDDQLDISYNYMNYILPMIQRFYFPGF